MEDCRTLTHEMLGCLGFKHRYQAYRYELFPMNDEIFSTVRRSLVQCGWNSRDVSAVWDNGFGAIGRYDHLDMPRDYLQIIRTFTGACAIRLISGKVVSHLLQSDLAGPGRVIVYPEESKSSRVVYL